MKRIITGIGMGTLALCLSTGLAVAARGGMSASHTTAQPTSPATQTTTPSGQTRGKGQPNQECGSTTAPTTPGNSSTGPGSAFNENGTAGTKYAGEQPQNSKNPTSVSQYDTACAHQPGG